MKEKEVNSIGGIFLYAIKKSNHFERITFVVFILVGTLFFPRMIENTNEKIILIGSISTLFLTILVGVFAATFTSYAIFQVLLSEKFMQLLNQALDDDYILYDSYNHSLAFYNIAVLVQLPVHIIIIILSKTITNLTSILNLAQRIESFLLGIYGLILSITFFTIFNLYNLPLIIHGVFDLTGKLHRNSESQK